MARRPPDRSPDPVRTGDGEIAELARRYRHEAIATLIAVSRDPRASASARAQAASKLLEYSDGRPSQARQITTADLAAMSAEQREDLWSALVEHHEADMPGELKRLHEEAIEEVLYKELPFTAFLTSLPQLTAEQRQKLLRPLVVDHRTEMPPRIVRPDAPSEPPEPPKPSRRLYYNPDTGEEPDPEPDPTPDPPRRYDAAPVDRTNDEPPLPRGCHPVIRATVAAPVNNPNGATAANGVHPDVLYRSTLPPRLALDSAFFGYWRKR